MRSTKNTRSVVIGIFILIGIAILILTILTLGGQQRAFGKTITVKAAFDDVNGLQKGNNIWFSGVKIGTVKKITIAFNSKIDVEMTIEEAARQYIHKDASARISQEGMIGNRMVAISTGTSNLPQVEDGDILKVEKAVTPDELMGTLQSNNKNLLEITNNFKIISKGLTEGKGTVGKLLTDETLFTEFQFTLYKLKAASTNAQQISADVAQYAAKLDRKGTFAHDIVNDTSIVPSLKRTAAEIEDVARTANTVAKTANDVVDKLNETGNNLNRSLQNTNAPAGMLLHDEAAANDIRVILKNFQSATQKLDEDLEALQHNFLLKGFFRKKAKREAYPSKKSS